VCLIRVGVQVAIFVVDPDSFSRWAVEKGFKGEVKALVNDKDVTRALLAELNAGAKAKGLMAFEMPKCVRLIDDPFSVENGMLTPTFKTKRPQIMAAYQKTIIEPLIAETNRIEEAEKRNVKG
jgi:long-chain acyl-CoA synthetase